MEGLIKNTMQDNKKKDRGFILITTYMIIFVLAIFSAAFFWRSKGFFDAAERSKNRLIAFNMAEAGIDKALVELKSNINYEGTGGFIEMEGDYVQGSYQAVVCPPSCDNLQEPADPSVRLIQAVGSAPGSDPEARAYESRTVTAYVQYDTANLFDFAVFANQDIKIPGHSDIDSYDSREGPYDAASAGEDGDVGTNSIVSNSFELNAHSTIHGDAVVGPEGDPDDVIKMSPHTDITGETTSSEEIIVYESMTTDIPSSGIFDISGQTVYVLPAGTYRYDSYSVTGQAKVTATGPVTIYVDGAVHIGGKGVVASDNKPPNFLVFQTTGAEVHINGHSSFYGAIYAPDSRVHINGPDNVYGAIVCDQYMQNGQADLHFDEAMKEVESSEPDGLEILSWREEDTFYSNS